MEHIVDLGQAARSRPELGLRLLPSAGRVGLTCEAGKWPLTHKVVLWTKSRTEVKTCDRKGRKSLSRAVCRALPGFYFNFSWSVPPSNADNFVFSWLTLALHEGREFLSVLFTGS